MTNKPEEEKAKIIELIEKYFQNLNFFSQMKIERDYKIPENENENENKIKFK